MKSMTPVRDLTAAARTALAGNWGKSIGVIAVYFILLTGVSLIHLIGWLLQLVFSAPLVVGMTVYLLATIRRQNNPFSLLFYGFNCFSTSLCTYLLIALLYVAWMVPFAALSVSVVFLIKSLPVQTVILLEAVLILIMTSVMLVLQMRYGLALYVVADDPSISARQAVRRGVELMRGNYWRLGLLWLRFTGWILLSVLTLGIGFIWLAPYYMAALTAFYDDLAGNG